MPQTLHDRFRVYAILCQDRAVCMSQAVCMKQRIIQFIVDNSCTLLERIRSQQGTVFLDTQEQYFFIRHIYVGTDLSN